MSSLKNNVADIIWSKPGDLQIVSMQARFSLSELYLIRAEVKSLSIGLDPKTMLNKEAEIHLKCGKELGDTRKFNGIITRFQQGRTRHGNLKQAKPVYSYLVEIRPKMWLLNHQFRSKIYQDQTVQDTVNQILGDHGVNKQWKTKGAFPTRDYIVQYQESDFNFVNRLLEEEGITYFFDSESGKVVFNDNPGGHPDCRPLADAAYVEEVSPRFQHGKHEFINDFSYEESISSGAFAVNHYNYETAMDNILGEKQEDTKPLFSALETYDHTYNYPDAGEGNRYAKLRQEGSMAMAMTGQGTTSCRSFEAGYVVNIKDHFRSECNGRWLLTSTMIGAEQGQYRCQFSCLKADVPFRPPNKTPRPRVYGLQTAVVTGPKMQEPYLDNQGRCKIQFHWDREGPRDEGSSMWVRVSNNYAGKDYGIQWIPRVGHEVLVTFIDGDPDLPIVTGRVYNSYNTNPLARAQQYQNIIKTIKDNHIIFDDEDSKELIDIRAHLDMNTLVERDDTQTVRHDREIAVDHNHDERIGNNMTIAVAKDLTEDVGNDFEESVGHDYDITVGNDMSTKVGDDKKLSVGDNLTETIGDNMSVSVGKNYTKDVGQNATVSVGKNIVVSGDKNATITIKDKLTVKVGKATMVLKKNGDIQVKGKTLNVKCSGNIVMKGSKIGLN